MLLESWSLWLLALGLMLSVGPSYLATPAQARPAEMPANPYMLYLAPQGTVRGLVNDGGMQARGAVPVRDWQSARLATTKQPLDAILIDASLLNAITPSDIAWLRAQFRDGVTIIGLGVDDDQFAHILGQQTFRVPTEANVPIGPTGYRLVRGIVVGNPDDLKTLESSNWIERLIRGERADTIPAQIKHPLANSFTKSRGHLDSERDLEGLFFRIRSSIEETYKVRAEFQQMMKNFKEK